MITKGVYSIRKEEQDLSVDETVQSLSHTLMRLNMTCVKDNSPIESNDLVNNDYEIMITKRAYNEDISKDEDELECNRVCFVIIIS